MHSLTGLQVINNFILNLLLPSDSSCSLQIATGTHCNTEARDWMSNLAKTCSQTTNYCLSCSQHTTARGSSKDQQQLQSPIVPPSAQQTHFNAFCKVRLSPPEPLDYRGKEWTVGKLQKTCVWPLVVAKSPSCTASNWLSKSLFPIATDTGSTRAGGGGAVGGVDGTRSAAANTKDTWLGNFFFPIFAHKLHRCNIASFEVRSASNRCYSFLGMEWWSQVGEKETFHHLLPDRTIDWRDWCWFDRRISVSRLQLVVYF